jgi:hypothetical protein
MTELILANEEYLKYIKEHYLNVQKAWDELQSKCRDKNENFINDDWLYHSICQGIKYHDMSKFSEFEFIQYRRRFYPTREELKDKDIIDRDFEKAWAHHKEQNRHHWENWTTMKDDHPGKIVCLVENICDWMAMSYKFKDTARQYYERNKAKILMPKDWEKRMYEIFRYLEETR